MSIADPKQFTTAFFQDTGFKDLPKEDQEARIALESKMCRSSTELRVLLRNQERHHNRPLKCMSSRGIRRIKSKVDKAEHPRQRHQRPRNGFAD